MYRSGKEAFRRAVRQILSGNHSGITHQSHHSDTGLPLECLSASCNKHPAAKPGAKVLGVNMTRNPA
jgi:hypothetical protein